MPVAKLLGDVLQDLQGSKASGVLFVAVKEKSENLVRIFFQEGQIRHVSYGQCSGKDCLDILDCYELDTAYFVKNMKAPAGPANLPTTPQIIQQVQKRGQSITMQ